MRVRNRYRPHQTTLVQQCISVSSLRFEHEPTAAFNAMPWARIATGVCRDDLVIAIQRHHVPFSSQELLRTCSTSDDTLAAQCPAEALLRHRNVRGGSELCSHGRFLLIAAVVSSSFVAFMVWSDKHELHYRSATSHFSGKTIFWACGYVALCNFLLATTGIPVC